MFGGWRGSSRRQRLLAMFLVVGGGLLCIGFLGIFAFTRAVEDAMLTPSINTEEIRRLLFPLSWFFVFISVASVELVLFVLYNHLLREEASGGFLDRVFRRVVEEGPDTVAFIDREGTILYESPSAERVIGFSPRELVGRNIFEFVHPGDRSFIKGQFAVLVRAHGSTTTIQVRMRHRDGSYHWIEMVSTNMLRQSNVRAIVSSYRDVTERLKAEEDELLRAVRHQRKKIHRGRKEKKT